MTYVRFFRDYSIAELAFMFVTAVMFSYMSFGSSAASLQAGVCEELGRQPDLLRDMAESGLNLENCEYWFGRAAVAVLGVMLVFAVIRVSRRFPFLVLRIASTAHLIVRCVISIVIAHTMSCAGWTRCHCDECCTDLLFATSFISSSPCQSIMRSCDETARTAPRTRKKNSVCKRSICYQHLHPQHSLPSTSTIIKAMKRQGLLITTTMTRLRTSLYMRQYL